MAWEVETDQGWQPWLPGVRFGGFPGERLRFTLHCPGAEFQMEAFFVSEHEGTQINLQTKRRRRIRCIPVVLAPDGRPLLPNAMDIPAFTPDASIPPVPEANLFPVPIVSSPLGAQLPEVLSETDAVIALVEALGVPFCQDGSLDHLIDEEQMPWTKLKFHRDLNLLANPCGERHYYDFQGDVLGFEMRPFSQLGDRFCRFPGGELPHVFHAFEHIRRIAISASNVTGTLPSSWPKSLVKLDVSDNPDLAGVITSALIFQCEEGIAYHGCKKVRDPKTGVRNSSWMQGPFVVGVSMASEDIRHVFANGVCSKLSWEGGHHQHIDLTHRLKDVPRAGDPQYPMFAIHGPRWIAWQDVWLSGLQQLCDCDVHVLIGEDRFPYLQFFRPKFLRDTDDSENAQCHFDPTYELPGDQRARCILDWERLQLLKHAEQQRLRIRYLETQMARDDGGSCNVSKFQPDWYR